MGCSSSFNSENHSLTEQKIKKAIESGNSNYLNHFFALDKQGKMAKDIDEFLFEGLKSMYISIPAYCILCGQAKIFKLIYEKYNVSVHKLEKILAQYGLSGLGVICTKGFYELLEIYLPFSLSIDPTIYLNKNSKINQNKPQTLNYSPIHLAIYYGYIPCVKIIFDYFSDSNPPWWLSFDYQDPATEENSALIACKSGNFSMIMYLYNYCGADFRVLNKDKENALQILLSNSKDKETSSTLRAVKYLIEVIRIDITYGIQKTLSYCNSKEIHDYIKKKHTEQEAESKKALQPSLINFHGDHSFISDLGNLNHNSSMNSSNESDADITSFLNKIN
jgi:hypothetical protein